MACPPAEQNCSLSMASLCVHLTHCLHTLSLALSLCIHLAPLLRQQCCCIGHPKLLPSNLNTLGQQCVGTVHTLEVKGPRFLCHRPPVLVAGLTFTCQQHCQMHCSCAQTTGVHRHWGCWPAHNATRAKKQRNRRSARYLSRCCAQHSLV